MEVFMIIATDLVDRKWVSWPIAAFSSLDKAEKWLFENGCVVTTNPAGKAFFHDGVRTFDILHSEVDQPEKFVFAHAAGV